MRKIKTWFGVDNQHHNNSEASHEKYFDHSLDYLDESDAYEGSDEFLPNEMIMNILEYLDGFTVIVVGGLISKQFRYCTRRVSLREINVNGNSKQKSCFGNRYAKQYGEISFENVDSTFFEQVIDNLNCTNLRKLTLGNNYSDPLELMARCEVFNSLEELKIYGANEYDLAPIFGSAFFSNLTCLHISGSASIIGFHQMFSDQSTLRNLKQLTVNKSLTPLQPLTNWKFASQLTYFSASDCLFSETDFVELVSPESKLCNLTYLNIQNSFIGQIDRMKERLLSETSNFTKLKTFILGHNLFSPFALSPRAQFQSMITLDMSNLKIGEKSFKSLIRNQSLKNLQNLIVKDCRLGWEFIESLVNPTINCLKSLKCLNMNNNKVYSKGLELLSTSILLLQLQIIELDSNFIGIEGATTILTYCERFKHLKLLSLTNNNFGSRLIELRECNQLKGALKVDFE